jgi:hypothetical protein
MQKEKKMIELQTFNQGSCSVHRKWIFTLIALIMTLVPFAFAQSPPPGSAPEGGPAGKQHTRIIRLAIPELSGTYLYRFAELQYTEACMRLGYGFELYSFPAERALVEANSGRMDGEAGRIRFDPALAAKYPNLVRVTEPIVNVAWTAYTADPAIRLNDWKDLTGRNLVVGYPRGIKVFEKRLPGHVDAKDLYEITDIRQGLRMLRRGRIDVMCGLQSSVDSILAEAEFMDSGITLAGTLEKLPVFPYLHKKHRALAPRLAAALKAMKKDGTYDRFLKEAKSIKSQSVKQQ